MEELLELLKESGYYVNINESTLKLFSDNRHLMTLTLSNYLMSVVPGPGYGHMKKIELPMRLSFNELIDEIHNYEKGLFIDYDSNGFEYLMF